MRLQEETYVTPRFSSLEELEREVEFWDATTAQWLADCPRRGEYAITRRVIPTDEAYPLRAGRAIHAGLAVLYSTGDEELALQTVREEWGYDSDWRLPPGHKYHYLHLGHLEVVFKNYLDWRRKHDTFTPLIVHRDELDLTRVLAASWLVTPDDKVVLGESKIVMEFDVETLDGPVNFVYSGRPDLPISMGGAVNMLDHKSTSAYLSEWYFSQYKFSNQLRGYAKMLQVLLGKPVYGTLINGIYVGERASLDEFKGEKFSRFGPMTYTPAHLDEAIKNQYYWRKSLDMYKAWQYFPQHTSKMCQGCPYAALCNSSPSTREQAISTDYAPTNREFMNL